MSSSSVGSVGSLSPSIVGSVVRFRRLVIVIVVVCAVIALIYTGIVGSAYSAKAQLVIQQPPTFLPPFPVSGSHTTAASYVNQQVAIIESQAVSYGAAAIVNNRVSGAQVTGSQIHSGLTVKPQTGAAAGTNTTTQILVTMPTAELAAASANAVVASYITALHGQITAQANQSINALNKEIVAVKAELASIPSPTPGTKSTGSSGTSGSSSSGTGSSGNTPHTTTTVIKVPKTTTTRVPRTTTTRVPRTTTTKPAKPTTTTTTTSASSLGQERELGSLQLTAFRATATTAAGATTTTAAGATTTTTAPASTTTTTTAPSSSSGSGLSAAEKVPLVATLTNLTRSRSQVQVDEQADLSYKPTVFPATIPSATSNGNLLRNFVIGALLGLLIGVIAAYAIAVRRRQFENATEPELMYSVPLVAAVPAFNQNAWLPTGLPILTEPAEEPAEQIRVIATALRSIRNSHPSLVVAFSSAIPRSGTTAMVANTGLALAKMEERVLVVDGDPINRGLTLTLTDTDLDQPLSSPRPGFSEVVGGRPLMESVTPADANGHLSVLTAGMDPNLAMHRWSPQSMRLALRDAAEHFDMVLIDVPPMGSSSYGMDLADASENLIMVIPYLDLIQVHERLKERMLVADLKLLGYIFNGGPSRNHFSPYYPILYDFRSEVPGVAAPQERALPITVSSSVRSSPQPPPPPPPPSPTQHVADDITGVTTAVRRDDPVAEQEHGLDDTTQEVPSVDPE